MALDGDYWQLWVMNPDGSEARPITGSRGDKIRCSWHPSGEELLVNTLDGPLRVDLASGRERKLEVPHVGMTDTVFSPDGQRIAYALSTAGSIDDHEIWVMDLSLQRPRRLTVMPGLQHAPSWDSTGTWIYFQSSRRGDLTHDVWRVSSIDGSRQQMTAGSRYQFGVATARDGRIAYSSNRSGDYEIYSQYGTEIATRWTRHPKLDAGPTWGPNGLAFHSTRTSSRPQIFLLEEPGGEPVQLTNHSGGARDPEWWIPAGDAR